jgi:hypothetical protein
MPRTACAGWGNMGAMKRCRWHRMERAGIVAAALMLACCAAPPPPDQTVGFAAAKAKAKHADERCRADHAAGILKTEFQQARCIRTKVVPIFSEAGYPYMDLVYVLMAAKETAARKVDRGQVTRDRAEAQLDELGRRIHAEELRRFRDQARPIRQAAVDDGLLRGLDILAPRGSPSAKPEAAESTEAAPKLPASVVDQDGLRAVHGPGDGLRPNAW